MSMPVAPPMTRSLEIPFERGKAYTRFEINKFLKGGNPQSGIVYSKEDKSTVACFTGSKNADLVGYGDRELDGGTWDYYGQGRTGDQKLRGANAVLHNALTVLLFEKVKGQSLHEYKGQFKSAGFREELSTSGERRGNTLIVFTLKPLL